MKGGATRFMEVVKDELKDIPVDVKINVAGKQKNLAERADKLTNLVREFIANGSAIQQMPGIGKTINELLESSGFSPIDFMQITKPVVSPLQQGQINPQLQDKQPQQ